MKNLFVAVLFALPGVLSGCNNAERVLRVEPGSIEIESDVLSVSVAVSSSASWMAYCQWEEEAQKWLTFDYDDNTLLITVSETNESLEDRAAKIEIVSGDGLSRIVPVVQRAKNAIFNATPTSLAPFGHNGSDTQTVTVESNLSGGWDFSNSQPWLTPVRGEDGGTITVSVERSRELSQRVDTLIISPLGEAFQSLADTIPIIQEAAMLMVRSPETDILDAPAEGGELSFIVYAKESWTVSTDDRDERLSLVNSGFSGTGEELEAGFSLVLSLIGNTSTEPISFILTFSCGGEDYEYELIQAGAVE